MLYVNEPSIVVGKHQNALSEINLDFVRENNIKVARRLSGGGTVFHDFGNLNFSFIQTAQDKGLINFSKFLHPIIEVLQSLGVDAVAGDKNDILLDGFKISGNAEHIFKQRVLHHGTLLFNSHLDRLQESIKVKLDRFKDRSVQSRRSKVANISEYLPKPLSMDGFRKTVFDYLLGTSGSIVPYRFSDEEFEKIHQLEKEKFSTWEWNFGYSPNYEFRNSITVEDKGFGVSMLIEKGRIRHVEFLLGEKELNIFTELQSALINLRHDPEDIKTCLLSLMKKENEVSILPEDIMKLLF